MNIKKFLAGAVITAATFGSTVVPAFADIDDYLNNPGREQATEVGAQCDSGAGSGAFGYLGKDNNPGDPSWDGGNGTDPGTSGHQTGLNNSAVCGNRQGNL